MRSDLQLVTQVLNGRADAYASLVERYERLARAAALHVARDPHLAEDVAQEAFVGQTPDPEVIPWRKPCRPIPLIRA